MFKSEQGSTFLGDARAVLKKVEDNSVDLIITDPPYFIDGMGDDWDNVRLKAKSSKSGVIGGRPIGMKFDKNQGYQFQTFLTSVAEDLIRCLKPGGFAVCFSQARLYHRAACAFEDTGFEIRDMFAWHHNGQAKAFSQSHFVRKNKRLSEDEKKVILKELGNRKTPQLKPQLEPMVFAQKPKEGTFVDNWMKWKTGLIDVEVSLDASFPGNLMAVSRPSKTEKRPYNDHLTVKPVTLLSHLIRILSIPDQVVLDPFLGSGSTAVACIQTGRRFLGIEKEEENYKIANRRIEEAESQKSLI